MRRFLLAFGLFVGVLLAGRPLPAQETYSLATPIVKTSAATYRLSYLTIDVDNLRIQAVIVANNGDTIQKVYDTSTTPSGSTLLHNLNIGNFSGNSLIKQIYQRLQTDNVIPAGTIGGVPQ